MISGLGFRSSGFRGMGVWGLKMFIGYYRVWVGDVGAWARVWGLGGLGLTGLCGLCAFMFSNVATQYV